MVKRKRIGYIITVAALEACSHNSFQTFHRFRGSHHNSPSTFYTPTLILESNISPSFEAQQLKTMPLDAIDEYDIQRSFEVMDDEKVNRISLKNFHTLYLGLGFQPRELTLQELTHKVGIAIVERKERGDEANTTTEDMELIDVELDNFDNYESFIPLSVVLQILSQHRRDRLAEIKRCFQLVDRDDKGYLTVDDLQQLSYEMGEPLSTDEARALLENTEQMNCDDFRGVFAPPSP